MPQTRREGERTTVIPLKLDLDEFGGGEGRVQISDYILRVLMNEGGGDGLTVGTPSDVLLYITADEIIDAVSNVDYQEERHIELPMRLTQIEAPSKQNVTFSGFIREILWVDSGEVVHVSTNMDFSCAVIGVGMEMTTPSTVRIGDWIHGAGVLWLSSIA